MLYYIGTTNGGNQGEHWLTDDGDVTDAHGGRRRANHYFINSVRTVHQIIIPPALMIGRGAGGVRESLLLLFFLYWSLLLFVVVVVTQTYNVSFPGPFLMNTR